MDTLNEINITRTDKINLDIDTTVILFDNTESLLKIIKNTVPINSKYDSLIKEIEGKFKSNYRQESIILISHPDNSKKFHKIIIIGYPKKELKTTGLELDEFRHIGYKIHKGMTHNQISSVNVVCPYEFKHIECILEGLLLSTYTFNMFKTKSRIDKQPPKTKIRHINIICSDRNTSFNKLVKNLISRIEVVFFCKDLVNLPPNHLKPDTYVKHILNTIKDVNLPIKTTIINSSQLKKMRMNLVLSVGQSSKGNNARVLILEYNPKNTKNPDCVLLGKGVTYDTGGVSLKSSKGLKEGKFDMAGSAVVISTIIGCSLINSKKHIIAYCPIAENNIDSESFKIGDVIKSYSGSTVEIDDTDAEGRLLMADCLSHIVEKYPKSPIIDVSTLTQQQEDLSCRLFTTLQGTNNRKIADKLIQNGEIFNEQVVELPIKYQLKSKLESKIADIKNSSDSCKAQLMLSSIFLNHFIKDTTNWTHLDIAGPSVLSSKEVPYILGEASGIGVRLLMGLF
jgi:leucyl aminopeptidase